MPMGFEFTAKVTNGKHGFSPETRKINDDAFFCGGNGIGKPL
jgi:hypothetical protein